MYRRRASSRLAPRTPGVTPLAARRGHSFGANGGRDQRLPPPTRCGNARTPGDRPRHPRRPRHTRRLRGCGPSADFSDTFLRHIRACWALSWVRPKTPEVTHVRTRDYATLPRNCSVANHIFDPSPMRICSAGSRPRATRSRSPNSWPATAAWCAASRRWVRDAHAAEDVCQAAFLVLAKKAGAIRWTATIGPWLHATTVRPRA